MRLQGAAERYLCATDHAYDGDLSEPSKHSLSLPGGPMSDDEIAAFHELEFHQEAVRVRLWDDRAKAVGVRTPTFADFRDLLSGSVP